MNAFFVNYESSTDASLAMDGGLQRQSSRVANQHFATLYTRAKARHLWPALGFRDEVAALLVERLGGAPEGLVVDGENQRQYLVRSHWFDQRCRQFFEQHPKGLCIDLGAGLSTRFHRLCRSADWPRFRWVDVDLPEVIRMKAALLPRTDNYYLVSANLAVDDWLYASGWQAGTPLLITMEGVLMHLTTSTVMQLFEQISKNCEGNAFTEVVFDYIRPLQLQRTRLAGLISTLIARQDISPTTYLSALSNAGEITRILPNYALLRDGALENSDRHKLPRILRWMSGSCISSGAHLMLVYR